MISNDLLEKIITISKHGMLIDKTLIRIIVRELISNTDSYTRRRFKLVRFKHSDNFCAQANCDTGELRVSLKTCYEDANDYDNASVLEKNLHILAIIIHEVVHLEEASKIREYNVEGKLIKLSNYQTNYFKNGDVNYDTYYTNPSEKIAYALSYKKLLEIIGNYPGFIQKYPKVYYNIKREYIERLEYGYKKIGNGRYNVPLLDFTESLNNKKMLNKVKYKLYKKRSIVNISKMSLEERFMYGLPITKRKVKQLEKIKKQTER